jgi:hypothetical protein
MDSDRRSGKWRRLQSGSNTLCVRRETLVEACLEKIEALIGIGSVRNTSGLGFAKEGGECIRRRFEEDVDNGFQLPSSDDFQCATGGFEVCVSKSFARQTAENKFARGAGSICIALALLMAAPIGQATPS